jgi:hypothetical protein
MLAFVCSLNNLVYRVYCAYQVPGGNADFLLFSPLRSDTQPQLRFLLPHVYYTRYQPDKVPRTQSTVHEKEALGTPDTASYKFERHFLGRSFKGKGF